MEISQELGMFLIGFIITITAIIIAVKLLHDRTEEDKEELSPKEKMYKAITALIYIIIAIILIPIAIKILFWAGILTASQS